MQGNGSAPVDLEGFRASMRAAGIEEVVEPTLQVYYEEARATFDSLAEAVASDDAESVRAAAHSLKSSSGNIWAQRAASLFETLEHAAQDRNTEAIESTFEALRTEFDRVVSFLAEAGVGR